MARLKIKDAPLLPVISGDEKIPTGGKGDFTLTPNMLADHFKSNSGFATDAELTVVDNKLKSHTDNKNNPHQTTKEQVGLGSVDNTSDINKPVSNATSIALDTKADKSQVIIDLNLKADKSTTYTKTEVDSEFLSIYKNGAALPYDAAMEYAEGAVVVKDGELQKKQGASWVSATNKEYNLDYFVSEKTYPLHAEIMLENGDIVKSTVPNNTNDPNVDMTGWRLDDNTVESIADLIAIENPKNGQTVYVKSYFKPENLALVNPFFGGGKRVYVASRDSENDGFLCINGWVLVIENNTVSPEQAGAKVNDKTFDNSVALQKTFNSGFEVECLPDTYYTQYPVYHRSSFKLRGRGFWSKTRIYKITNNVGDLPDVLSPDGETLVSYRRDAVLIAIPDSGDYCHDVEISNILIGREWDESDPVFLTGYAYYAPYLAQSEFNSVWCNATRFTWYVVTQWMCTFNRCEGSGGEWVVGGLDGDVARGGTTSTYNSCWSKVIHIPNANAWTFTDMTTVTMNSCGTDGLGLLGVTGGAVIKAKNSGITINGFGIEVTHSENLFDFENCAVNMKALHFYQVFNNHGRIFKISGGVVDLDCSILKMMYTDTNGSIPDFAIVSNGGSFNTKNVTSTPPIFGLSNAPQNKNAIIIAADSHGLIESNGSRQEWSEGDGINKTNRALQITNNTENIGVIGENAIHHSTNSFQLGDARLFRDGSGLLRQTRNSKPVDQYDGVPVGGIPIYPNDSQAKPIEGNVYFNSTTSKLMIFNSAAWMSVLLVQA